MKPLATIGDTVLHGGPAWKALQRVNGMSPPPSSGEPDRGFIEQPGERAERRPMAQQTLVKLERAAPSEPQSAEREAEMPKKKTRVMRGVEFQKEAVRKLLAAGGGSGRKDGEMAKLSRELGVAASLIRRWLDKHGEEIRAESSQKTLVSAPAKSAASVDQAAKNLVDVLGAYITAVVDARVDEAMKERMKRLL